MGITNIGWDHLANNVRSCRSSALDPTNGRLRNRADVVFLINDIPVALVEAKAANKPDGIDRGWMVAAVARRWALACVLQMGRAARSRGLSRPSST